MMKYLLATVLAWWAFLHTAAFIGGLVAHETGLRAHVRVVDDYLNAVNDASYCAHENHQSWRKGKGDMGSSDELEIDYNYEWFKELLRPIVGQMVSMQKEINQLKEHDEQAMKRLEDIYKLLQDVKSGKR